MAHPGGRPTKYDDSYLNEFEPYFETVGRGQTELPTVEGFALHIGVNVDTINNWCDALNTDDSLKHPEFASAIKELKDRQKKQLMDDGMYGGKEVNSPMAIFLLKANHGMIETEKRILAGDDENPIRLDVGGTLNKIYGDPEPSGT